MDALGLAILERELAADAAVLRDASAKAGLRLQERAGGFAEAAGYELARFYTVIEKSFERVCLAFENHFEKRQDYHERLLQRMAIDLPGIRPAFVPAEELSVLRDFKGFRHVVRHAYDLALRPERLAALAEDAVRIADAFPQWIAAFSGGVRQAQGWPDAG
jgi:hypothetical protein